MIRNYSDSDYLTVRSWWLDHSEIPPLPEMLPKDSTFILEDGGPKICITVYLTNCKFHCYLENFVKAPGYSNHENTHKIVKYAENFAKELGFKYLVCLSTNPGTKSRYEDLGYTTTLSSINTHSKEL